MTAKTKECWCPCKCGCEDSHEKLLPSGLCSDCEKGNHEIPPEGTGLVEALAPLHESIATQYNAVLQARLLGKQFLRNHDFAWLEWDGIKITAYKNPEDRGDPDVAFKVDDFEKGSHVYVAFENLKDDLLKLNNTNYFSTSI